MKLHFLCLKNVAFRTKRKNVYQKNVRKIKVQSAGFFEQKISNFIFTGIEWIPLNKIDIKKDNLQVILNFLETIEEDSDVQNVFTNMKEININ